MHFPFSANPLVCFRLVCVIGFLHFFFIDGFGRFCNVFGIFLVMMSDNFGLDLSTNDLASTNEENYNPSLSF